MSQKQNQTKPLAAPAKVTAPVVAPEVVEELPPVVETVETTPAPVEETPAVEEVEETQAPVEPAPVSLVVIQPTQEAPTPEAVETALAKLTSTEGSSLLKIALSDLADYAQAMAATKPQTKESAIRNQKRLFDVYQIVFKLEPVEFQKAMRQLVAVFRENTTGAFTEGKLFRGIQDIQLPKNDIRLFNHLSLLLLKAAELGVATAGRESDLSGIAKSLPTDQARQYLTQFFR